MTLQLALIFVGVAAFAAVAAVSVWQSRKGQSSILERTRGWFPKIRSLVDLERVKEWIQPKRLAERLAQREPSLMPSGEFDPASHLAQKAAPRESTTDELSAERSGRGSKGAHALDSEIGARPLKIDYWVRLAGRSLVSRDVALSVFREHEIPLEHPRAIHGRTDPGNAWLDLTTAPADEVFSDLIISLQMATRDGATNESELTRFNNLVYQMAEALNRPMQFDMSIEEALPEAHRLFRFCSEFDLVAVINIEPKPGSGFSGPSVARALDRAGMRLGKDEVYHLFDARTGVSRFSLTNRSTSGRFSYEDLESGVLRGLAMVMNVPQVARPSATFSDLVSVAHYVCSEIDGMLVDPDGDAISESHFDAIRRQIHSLEISMKKYGIEPGSEEAQRLF